MRGWLGLLLQICRVEDVIVEGIITGSVIHFHWVRDVVVHSSGAITASGLGMPSGFYFYKDFDSIGDLNIWI